MNILTFDETLTHFKLNKPLLKRMIIDGAPCLKIGREYRFIEHEFSEWQKHYLPLQKRLEKEFKDDKGRTLEDYSNVEETISFFKISKNKLYRLCRNGMPFVKVGKFRFFHLDDVIDYFRIPQTAVPTKIEQKNLVIKFDKYKDPYCWYDVTFNGENRRTKMVTKNPIHGSVYLANSYVTQRKEQISINIHSIPEFDKHLNLFGSKMRKKTLEIYKQLKNNSCLKTANHFDSLEQKTSTVIVPKTDTCLFVVDGSSQNVVDKWGAGVVKVDHQGMLGLHFKGDISTNHSQFSEFMAMIKAMEMVKEQHIPKAIIASDQLDYIEELNKTNSLIIRDWMRHPDILPTIHYFLKLYNELKNNITFIYVRNLKSKNINWKPLYQKAHQLSKILNVELELPVITKINTVQKPEKTLEIDFLRFENKMSLFQVKIDGKTKTKATKMNTDKASKAVLQLAYGYAYTSKEFLKIQIGEIPNFKKEMDKMASVANGKSIKTIRKMLNYLSEKTMFFAKIPFFEYLEKQEDLRAS